MPALDTIFTGGPVITMNDRAPSAEAVAVKDGRIVAVGSIPDVRAAAGAGAGSVSYPDLGIDETSAFRSRTPSSGSTR